MESLTRNLMVIEKVLNRYANRLDCSHSSLLAASYAAMKRCYEGDNYKKSIRKGKRILNYLMTEENES